MQRKYKHTICSCLFFNFTTKAVIGPKYYLGKSFQEVFNTTNNWISEKSGWITESTDAEYVKISIYYKCFFCVILNS